VIVKKLKVIEPFSILNQRCEYEISETVKHHSHQCTRLARYRIEGVNYCTQHAGERALNWFMEP